MPRSRRTQQTDAQTDTSDSGSVAGSKGKRKSKPTKPTRSRRQTVRERYAAAREEAQLAGVIPTTPEGAVRDEVVPSSVQTTPPMPGLVALAVRSGWSTPEEKKSGMVDELIAIVNNPELPAKVKVAAFNALRMADQSQWERDHPDEVAKAKGSAAQVSIHIQAASTIREMIERGEIRSVGAMLLPPQPSTSGDSGQQCEVETSSTS